MKLSLRLIPISTQSNKAIKSEDYIDRQQEVLKKLQRYCAYQDRCHQEVRTKILENKVYGDALEEIIHDLIKDNYLNEERFAQSYVRGKFRIKKWGRNKILIELKRRKVSSYCIKKGLKEIDEDEYKETIQTIVKKKLITLTGHEAIRRKKVFEYCYRRGYEPKYINAALGKYLK